MSHLLDPKFPVRIETSVDGQEWTSEGDYTASNANEATSYFLSQGRHVRQRQLHLPEGEDVVFEERAPTLQRE